MAQVELGDRLVKSGRTSDVTHGVVRRVDVMARIDYGGDVGDRAIGCFEIGPDDNHLASDGEISRGGDSGAVWMIHDHENDTTTDVFAGLHFAGEGRSNPDEHALACYPRSVAKKLDVMLSAQVAIDGDAEAPEAMAPRAGYDPDFLGQHVPMPDLSLSFKQDAVNFAHTDFIPYTHFTVCLSKRRRIARFVAWNIDGARKVTLGSKSFRKDGRVPEDTQLGNDVYVDNRLDRGHLARRADLAWGPIPEARQANSDSYFYTNIAPQHEAFNRSSMNGLWGELENLILTQAATRDIRVSVLGGPVFKNDDPVHRDTKIPRSFWKMVAYMGEDDKLRTAAFVLSQRDLVATLEGLDLDPFKMFQITLTELATTTGLDFSNLTHTDVLANPELHTPLPELTAAAQAEAFDRIEREVNGSRDLVL
jgi:endonuclease G